MFGAQARVPGVTEKRRSVQRPKDLAMSEGSDAKYPDRERNPFSVGELVFLKNTNGRCDEPWSGPHRISDIESSVAAEIENDGIPRHVSHLRRVPRKEEESRSIRHDSDSSGSESEKEEVENTESGRVRRSNRECRRPGWWSDYEM